MTIAPPRFRSEKRALAMAVAAVFPCAASAVYQSPDGKGQVLLYPYYTVQSAGGNAFNTYLSIVNATSRAKAVKVRFREGKNAREALGLNLYLSPNDVWTSSIGPSDGSSSSPAYLATADKSCTAPIIPVTGMQFRNTAYSGSLADGGPTSLDRTREGYIEVVEMATLANRAASYATLDSRGIPNNCAALQPENGFTSANVTPISAGSLIEAPNGGLSGTYVLINVANGLSFTGNATALSQFSAVPLFTDPGDPQPDLGSANPPVATTFARTPFATSVPSQSSLLMSGGTYPSGRDAVSATLMKATLFNEYVLDPGVLAATDWVVTFPTKSLYVARGTGPAIAPFTSNFGSSGSCEPIAFQFFNREEFSAVQAGSSFGGEPRPPGPSLCWSANVVAVGSPEAFTAVSNVFASVNAIAKATNGYANGWAALSFVGIGPTIGLTSLATGGQVLNLSTGATAAPPVNIKGLPAIGFMVRTLNNGLLNCATFGGATGTCVGSYGALLDHRYWNLLTPTP